jgi:hypothetical protein
MPDTDSEQLDQSATARLTVGYVNDLVRRLGFLEARVDELNNAPIRSDDIGRVFTLIEARLGKLEERSPSHRQGPKIANPEFFKGDRLLLTNFISQCQLKFAGEPSKFPDEKAKIYFAGSYLREGPYSWFQPLISADARGQPPPEFSSFETFTDALTTIYGDPNLVITSERELRALRQTTSVAQYIAEFQRLRQYVKHNEAALIDQFYHGLRDNVKDKLVNGPRSETLAEMMKAAATYDARIQERIIERRITSNTLAIPPRSTSSTPTNVPFTPSRTPSPAAALQRPPVPVSTRPAPVAPRAPNLDGTTPMILDSTRSGPVSATERERRRINNLCFYCGLPGHSVMNCPSSPPPRPRNYATYTTYPEISIDVTQEPTNESTHE